MLNSLITYNNLPTKYEDLLAILVQRNRKKSHPESEMHLIHL